MKEKHRFSKLQYQYFASYLVILLLVMMVMIFFAYRSFSRFHSQILLNRYQADLHLVQDAQDQLVSTLISIAGQMTNNDITPVRYADDPVKASRFSGKLASYRAVNDTFDEIFIHFSGDDYVYSSTSFFSMDRFVGQALNLEDVSPEELQNALEKTAFLTIWPEKRVQGYAVRSDTGIHSVVSILVPLSYPGGARVGTVMYLVETDQFAKWYESFGLKDADVVFLHQGQIITGQNRSGIPGEALLQAADAGQTALRYGGKQYHILTENGSSRLSCAALVSDEEFAVALSGSVKALVLVSAFAAAVAMLLITRFVQSRMRGIKLVHSMLADHEPTGNELLEIRDGIQRLIDENASMTTRLENMADVQRGEFVRRFLLGTFQDEDAFLQMAEQVSVNVDTRFFAVAIVAKAAESSYELTVDKIDRLFDEHVSGASLIPVSAENHLILLAFANEEGRLRAFLEGKFAGLKACSASMIMGVSGFHRAWTEGQRAYLEAENAFEMRFVKGNTAPIYFEELGENQTLEADYNRQAVDHLRQALRKGDEVRVEKALAEVSQAMHDTRSSLFGFRCMYSEIITAVSAEARQSGVNEEELYDLFRLSRCLSVDELDAMLKQVCRKIVTLQSKTETEEIPKPVRNAYNLIQRRFSEPGLTVASIAEEVGMSDSRLSVDFKRVYQETPLECITHARMHRAQHLLGHTEMPVKDIATECGYYDISAFNRRFKSYTGCTPQQYRQQGTQE
ncbi:MAG: AraC family transcriptional regulator [Clostridia bacterium]|nr:AraC family transcriptional regulator [Clostridia bacterium]